MIAERYLLGFLRKFTDKKAFGQWMHIGKPGVVALETSGVRKISKMSSRRMKE